MIDVTVTFDGNTDASEVRIDNVPVLLGTGEATVTVDGNASDHSVMWFVRGAPGSEYELQITAPASAKFTRSALIDGSTKDAGLHWFHVDRGPE